MLNKYINQKFNRLLIISILEGTPRYVMCRCDCGKEKRIKLAHIRDGFIQSCGCLRNQKASERAHVMRDAKDTHGLSKSRAYTIWHGMKQRCNNPNANAFKDYGGRGIKVCDRWLDFENFYADMGEPLPNLTLERKDNNGNYEPDNCCWATRKEQQSNRRNNRVLTFNGITKSATEWANELGIASQTVFTRISLGWSIEKILSTEKQMNLEGLKLGGMGNALIQRAKTHCKNGHPFDEKNTAWYKGTRSCRRCHADRQSRRLAKIPK